VKVKATLAIFSLAQVALFLAEVGFFRGFQHGH
jgi:hypothetical protein